MNNSHYSYNINTSSSNKQSYSRNLNNSSNNCNCNCCSCYCPFCCCHCQCNCHQENQNPQEFNKELNFDLNRNPVSFKPFNEEKYNSPLYDNKNPGIKFYSFPKSNQFNSFNRSNSFHSKKKIKNTLFKGKNNDREQSQIEFYNLLNSIENDDPNYNNGNDNKYNTPNFNRKKCDNFSINNFQNKYEENKLNNIINSYKSNSNIMRQNKSSNNINYNPFSINYSPNLTETNDNNVYKTLDFENKYFPNKNNNNNSNLFYNPIKNINTNQKNKNNNNDIQKFNFQFINNSGNERKDFIIEKLRNENQKLKNDISRKNKKNNNLNNTLSNLQNDLVNSQNEKNRLQNLFNKYDKMNVNNKNENKNLKKEVSYYKNQLSNISKDNMQLMESLDNLQNDLSALENTNKKLKNLEKENKKLKEEINSYKQALQNFTNPENENILMKEQNPIYLNNNNNIQYEGNNNKISFKQPNNQNIEQFNPSDIINENQKLKKQIADNKKYISKLTDENKKITNQRLSDQKNITDLVEKNKILNNQIINLQEENKNLIRKMNNLESERTKIKPYKYQNKLFKDLIIESEGRLNYNGIPSSINNNINNSNDSFKKIVTTSTTTSKQIINTSLSKLMNKLKIETDLSINSIENNKKKVLHNYNIENLGDNLIFKINSGNNIMCYDFTNNNFYFFDFADYNNFSNNFITDENNGNIFLSYNSILYIVTGKNSDLFYEFNPQKKAMDKLSSLNNNHSKGSLIPYKNSIICLSGEHNKKCEIYSIHKNEWNEMPEMNFERSEFGTCIINEQYLFSIFGFNSPKNEYLNNVEYLDLLNENGYWKNLDYKSDNFSLYIKGLLALNYFDNKIILIGGFNGELNKPVENFAQIILGNNFDKEIYVENVDRKLKDIHKNKCYMFSNGYTQRIDEKGRIYNIAYDNDERIHIFEMQNMLHDVISFESTI